MTRLAIQTLNLALAKLERLETLLAPCYRQFFAQRCRHACEDYFGPGSSEALYVAGR
jgi:hypothetical protein